MLRFNKLRLSGFKSFVDGTELLIEPGLTGVVGPNGCGKSNLVEALRWVMGESSAKQMRGGEMDDVIFNGTGERPPRNIAEVALNLDNNDRTAPARYNDQAELSVSRRIERGSGSTFRINGKEVRARDVQILFADAASGARSVCQSQQGRQGTAPGLMGFLGSSEIGERMSNRELVLDARVWQSLRPGIGSPLFISIPVSSTSLPGAW